MKQKITGQIIMRKLGVHIAMLCGATAAGLLLLFAVHMLPVKPMEEHIRQSLPMIEREFEEGYLLEDYPGSFMGGFTDCLMLEHAVYQSDGHSMLEQVLCMYRGESSEAGWAPGYSLIDYLGGKPQLREESYARYWHGYLVLLKPFLLLTSYTTIRMTAAVLQLILTGMVLMAFLKRGEEFLGTAFLVSLPFFYYFSLFTSLSLSICFYLLAAVILAELKWDGKLRAARRYGEFFFAAGMLTSYFDFLTYPIVILGFPLCIYLYWNRESWKDELLHIMGYSAEWGAGYLGLWAMKWIVTDLFTGNGTIADAVSTLSRRTEKVGDTSGAAGLLEVLKVNVDVYANWAFGLLLLGTVIWLAVYLYKKRRAVCGESLQHAALLLFVALYPFIWFCCTQNHSWEHWMFTYKILSVTVFAGICAVGRMCRE